MIRDDCTSAFLAACRAGLHHGRCGEPFPDLCPAPKGTIWFDDIGVY
jgi:hypothetical protein